MALLYSNTLVFRHGLLTARIDLEGCAFLEYTIDTICTSMSHGILIILLPFCFKWIAVTLMTKFSVLLTVEGRLEAMGCDDEYHYPPNRIVVR